MGFQIKATVTGLDEVMKALDLLKQGLRNRILRKALTKAGKIVRDAAKAKVPRETGRLKISIGTLMRTYSSGMVMAIVGPRKGFGKTVTVRRTIGGNTFRYRMKRDPLFYAHLVEYGTRPHALGTGSKLVRKGKQGKDVQSGHMHPGATARPFLRPAWDANKAKVRRVIVEVIKTELANEVKKVAARRAR